MNIFEEVQTNDIRILVKGTLSLKSTCSALLEILLSWL